MRPSFSAVRNGDKIIFNASYMATATNYRFEIGPCELKIPTAPGEVLLDVAIKSSGAVGGCAMTQINGQFEIDDPNGEIQTVKFQFQGNWMSVQVFTRCGN